MRNRLIDVLKSPLALILVLSFISGCATKSAPVELVTDTNPYYQNALNALKIGADADAEKSLAIALTQYEATDNILGQWQVYNLKIKMLLQQENTAAAENALTELRALAALLDQDLQHYETLLLCGRVFGDQQYYRQALEFAADPLSESVVLTYLGDHDKAMLLIDKNGDQATGRHADKAFVYYEYGQEKASRQHLASALSFYQASRDPRGIADTLMALALHSVDQGRKDEAIELGLRAKKTLLAIGDTERANAVSRWLDEMSA